jgi:hypothetical protein
MHEAGARVAGPQRAVAVEDRDRRRKREDGGVELGRGEDLGSGGDHEGKTFLHVGCVRNFDSNV